MRILLQRVTQAEVLVAGRSIAQINHGILAYVGLGHQDSLQTSTRLIDKLLTYRIFADESGKMSLNVAQVSGEVLLVSQFTLLAQTAKGLRPDFKPAMAYEQAAELFLMLCEHAKSQYPKVCSGEFGADMQVCSVNDGPINFLLEI